MFVYIKAAAILQNEPNSRLHEVFEFIDENGGGPRRFFAKRSQFCWRGRSGASRPAAIVAEQLTSHGWRELSMNLTECS
jgi:hypothetical protein